MAAGLKEGAAGLGVDVAAGVSVGSGAAVSVGVSVGAPVAVDVAVFVGMGVAVAVKIDRTMDVFVTVGVCVSMGVEVMVAVAVGWGVGVAVAIAANVAVGATTTGSGWVEFPLQAVINMIATQIDLTCHILCFIFLSQLRILETVLNIEKSVVIQCNKIRIIIIAATP